MGRDELERLLQAEKEAQRTMSLWRDRAQRAIRDASSDMEMERRKAIGSLQARFSAELEATKVSATAEAERIKNDGIELARGLSGRARSKVGVAVEMALESLLG